MCVSFYQHNKTFLHWFWVDGLNDLEVIADYILNLLIQTLILIYDRILIKQKKKKSTIIQVNEVCRIQLVKDDISAWFKVKGSHDLKELLIFVTNINKTRYICAYLIINYTFTCSNVQFQKTENKK